MSNIVFLLSMPGGSEWLIVVLYGLFVLLFPIVSIIFYFQLQRLKRENRELRDMLNKK